MRNRVLYVKSAYNKCDKTPSDVTSKIK